MDINNIYSSQSDNIQDSDKLQKTKSLTKANAKDFLRALEHGISTSELKYNNLKKKFEYTKKCYFYEEGVHSDEYNNNINDQKITYPTKSACESTISIPIHLKTVKKTELTEHFSNDKKEGTFTRMEDMKLITSPKIYSNTSMKQINSSQFQDKISNEMKQATTRFKRIDISPRASTPSSMLEINNIHCLDNINNPSSFWNSHEQSKPLMKMQTSSIVNKFNSAVDNQRNQLKQLYLFNQFKEKKKKKHGQILKLSAGSIKTEQVKRKKLTKNTKFDINNRVAQYSALTRKKSFISRMDKNTSVMEVIKTRDKKIKSANSKSTIRTKDTRFSHKKELKRRKQKSQKTSFLSELSHSKETFTKFKNIGKREMEINHDNILNNFDSISLSSTKHLKSEPVNSSCNKIMFKIESPKITSIQSNQTNNILQKTNVEQEKQPIFNNVNIVGFGKRPTEKHCNEMKFTKIDEEKSEGYNCEDETKSTHYIDTIRIKRYEQPTCSSKLKQKDRLYFNRFHFQNIPFIVGTSITPSHNLGLNIQQVANLMKNRQFVMNSMTHLLIRKVSKGIHPISSLLREMNEKSLQDLSIVNYRSSTLNYKISNSRNILRPLSIQPSMYNKIDHTSSNTMQHIYNNNWTNASTYVENVKENTMTSYWNKQYNNCSSEISSKYNKLTNPFISRKKIEIPSVPIQKSFLQQNQDELESNANKNQYDSVTNTIKIKNLFIKLHDEFEKLNKKYEKLQNEAEKSSNPALLKEISNLEKELESKETEIHVIVHLYKELMALKQQIKSLSRQNSLVCVTTECHQPFRVRSQTTNATQIFNTLTNNSGSKPSTAIRLTALLRKIQAFQKQLQISI